MILDQMKHFYHNCISQQLLTLKNIDKVPDWLTQSICQTVRLKQNLAAILKLPQSFLYYRRKSKFVFPYNPKIYFGCRFVFRSNFETDRLWPVSKTKESFTNFYELLRTFPISRPNKKTFFVSTLLVNKSELVLMRKDNF